MANYSLGDIFFTPFLEQNGIGQYYIGMTWDNAATLSGGGQDWVNGKRHTIGAHAYCPSDIKRMYVPDPKIDQFPQSCQIPMELFFYRDTLVCIYMDHEYPVQKKADGQEASKKRQRISIKFNNTSNQTNTNSVTHRSNDGPIRTEFTRTDISCKRRNNFKFSREESFSEKLIVCDTTGYRRFQELFAEIGL